MVLDKEGPNDGLVSVSSAHWVGSKQTRLFSWRSDYSGVIGKIPRNPRRRQPSGSGRMGQHCTVQVGRVNGERDQVQTR